jgi:N-acetylglucosamine-6-sulfatase
VSDIITEESLRFIRENADRPFLLYMAHKAVHADFVPARRHQNLYSDQPIPRPASMDDTPENYRGRPEWVRRQRNSWHGVDGMYNHQTTFETFYRDYCRTLMGVDDSVGAIIDELDRRRLLKDTLIIYMGDNGFQFGEHGLIDKRTMYEASIRVPMIAHCPNLFQGNRRVDGMALNIDMCPTLLDAAGAAIPASSHGRSLLPLLLDRDSDWRTEFLYEYFWERDFPQTPTVIGLRSGRFSFMRYHGIWDLDELYDVERDPHQMSNLLADVRVTTESGRLFNRVKDPELKKLVAGFEARLSQILGQTGGRMEPIWRNGSGFHLPR